ncbi:hypothetical protein AALN73_05870 [Bacteroides stercorirosoris]|uniref:hypothetical protein n=1 Tax=Bacteroides stercorirosoris TaxID=871324 RepID=UPI0023F79FAF|nr:hypothetical protein [Bacteroides stercorirosoris]
MRARKRKILTKKVYSRVTPETYQRLDAIKSKYGFSSVYEIIQSLIHCFLRVADPASDAQIEPVPYDIEVMFDEMSQAEKHVEFDKPKRRISNKSVNDE